MGVQPFSGKEEIIMQTGTIFNIQPFSVYDGPGIRTTVFLKGCNLRCLWCHNPESWKIVPQLQFQEEKCVGCGNCFKICPKGAHQLNSSGHVIDRNLCVGCGLCAQSCYAGALVLTGKKVTTDEVMARLLEDASYFKNSGGGVTFSGGEAMMQLKFLKELLIKCKEAGIHTAVDTAGHFPFEQYQEILPYTDLFLYDIKAYDPETHRRLTGVDNYYILENLPLLLQNGAEVIVRIPCIPDGNWQDMEQIARYLEKLPLKQVELLAYHRLGEGKRKSLGMEMETFPAPSVKEMEALLETFKSKGIPAVYNR